MYRKGSLDNRKGHWLFMTVMTDMMYKMKDVSRCHRVFSARRCLVESINGLILRRIYGSQFNLLPSSYKCCSCSAYRLRSPSRAIYSFFSSFSSCYSLAFRSRHCETFCLSRAAWLDWCSSAICYRSESSSLASWSLNQFGATFELSMEL